MISKKIYIQFSKRTRNRDLIKHVYSDTSWFTKLIVWLGFYRKTSESMEYLVKALEVVLAELQIDHKSLPNLSKIYSLNGEQGKHTINLIIWLSSMASAFALFMLAPFSSALADMIYQEEFILANNMVLFIEFILQFFVIYLALMSIHSIRSSKAMYKELVLVVEEIYFESSARGIRNTD